ncbi:hypothetical protein QQX98_000047 [Neonectria punicea]|uniref:Uncharacterized protein n=1 Tax=Neonectria punicea TaxID=979145 RepID=A0ABR1HWS3_9HYPO
MCSERPDLPSVDSRIPGQDLATLLARVEVLLQARTTSTESEDALVPTPTAPYREISQDTTERQQEPLATNVPASSHDGLAPDERQASTQPSPSTYDTASPVSGFSLTAQSQDIPCLVGLSLDGFSRTAAKPCPKQLEPLLFDDAEDYLECEHKYNRLILDPAAHFDISDVDLSFKTCWKNQQSFAKNVLPWVPIFDQQLCAKLV